MRVLVESLSEVVSWAHVTIGPDNVHRDAAAPPPVPLDALVLDAPLVVLALLVVLAPLATLVLLGPTELREVVAPCVPPPEPFLGC